MAARENRTFRAKMPTTRNDFIHCVQSKQTAIVLNHSLLADMEKELNKSKGNKTDKKLLKIAGISAILLGGWLVGGFALLVNGLTKDEIKGYDVYGGTDVAGKDIVVLIRKKDYDPKYDTIVYDNYVKSVSEKPLKGKIKA